jgi:hypothetical protein
MAVPVKSKVPVKKASPALAAKVIAVKASASKKPVAKAKVDAKVLAKPVVAKAIQKTTALKAVPALVKVKIVRDSFTMTEADHDLIKQCKKNAVAKGRETRKSEVLRAAIIAFSAWPIEQQLAAYQKLQPIKTGRPSKSK